MADHFEYAFQEREAQRYMKAGEMRRMLSPIDREVMRVIHGPKASARQRHITIRGVEKQTGLSAMAVMLAVYRLTGLGLIDSKDRPMPKRTDKGGDLPHRPRAGR